MKKLYTYITAILLLGMALQLNAQQTKSIDEMTKEDVLELSYDELLEMPFEDVLKLAEVVGVSLEELYEMLLNKEVSSASKKAESSFEAPLSTSVVSHDEIMQSGARTIEEALRLVPGIIVREKTTGNYDIHIRGNDNVPPDNMFLYSENSLTLVMIDGRPVYNSINGGTFWESLPVDLIDIDRIEVVRGPSSALYGPNAVSGVINIITSRPQTGKFETRADMQLGSLGNKIANLSLGQGKEKFGFRVSGNYQLMDRTTDEIYLFQDSRYHTKEELFDLTFPAPFNAFSLYDDDINELYEEPGRSRDRWGVNAFLHYTPQEDIDFALSIGTQHSNVLSSTFADPPSPMSGREIETSYLDLDAKVKGFSLKTNYMFGTQDVVRADEGFKIDVANFNGSLEYDFNLGNLNLRPGIALQTAEYDDSPYVTEGNGFINGKETIGSFAGSIRADYTWNEKFRFIAALRGETYTVSDDIFFPYQLIGSYNMNDKHMFRIVVSQANRGPFLVDSYSDYTWNRQQKPPPSVIKFSGSENLDLVKMNMIELGYRIKPAKSLQVDIEGFYTKTVDFGYLSPDSASANLFQIPGNPVFIPTYLSMAYQNIDLVSKQIGVSANIDWVAHKKLILKFFGTIQKTDLENVLPMTSNEIAMYMLQETATPSAPVMVDFPGVPVQVPMITFTSSTRPTHTIDEEHKSTPKFYGGFSINYSPIEKLNAFISSYYYSKQEMRNMYGTFETDPKMIVNMKVSYKVWGENSIYFNARNLFNSDKREFPLMDETQGVYLVGMNVNF